MSADRGPLRRSSTPAARPAPEGEREGLRVLSIIGRHCARCHRLALWYNVDGEVLCPRHAQEPRRC